MRLLSVRPLLITAIVLLAAFRASAATAPAEIFGDSMVLQRDKPAPVWGWAVPGERVTVSFAGQSKSAVAGDDGKWMVVLDPLRLSAEPQTLTIAGKETVEIKEVLVGDVWICSGQSNMGRSVERSLIPEGMKWEHPRIRYSGIGRATKYPVERYGHEEPRPWTVCRDEESTLGCVAVGFFFARRIQQDVDVPIGLLWEAFPGSVIREWMPRHAWRLAPELAETADKVDAWYPDTPHGREVWKRRSAEIEKWMTKAEKALKDSTPFPHPQPLMPEPKERDTCGFYNGKIHPLVPMAIRGVLWYQGESDMNNRLYDVQMKAMAQSWRDLFDVKGSGEDISFYWMQLQRSGDYCDEMIRQKQFNCLRLIPNSGMAVLLDLDVNVHPVNKGDSGIRLALWALSNDYGKKDVVCSGPLYRDHKVDGSRVIVQFDYAEGGLRIGEKELLAPPKLKDSGELDNWELLGADGKKWYPAVAKLDGERVTVTSTEVPAPTEVRYCYTTIPNGPFLYNAAGLPAAMFTSKETK